MSVMLEECHAARVNGLRAPSVQGTGRCRGWRTENDSSMLKVALVPENASCVEGMLGKYGDSKTHETLQLRSPSTRAISSFRPEFMPKTTY